MWSPKAPASPLKHGFNYSTMTRRNGIYEPPQTLFKVPCGITVRERKERLDGLVVITIILTVCAQSM